MSKAPSLLRLIIIRQSLITLGAIILSYGWLFAETRLTTDNLREHNLLTQAKDIAAAIHFANDGAISVALSAPLIESYGLSNGRYRYAVRDDQKRIVAGSGWPVGTLPQVDIDDEDGEIYSHGPDRETPAKFYGLALGARVEGRIFWVQVEQDSKESHVLTRVIVDDFFEDGGWVALPFLIALLAASILTIRRTLRPLTEISARAAAIEPNAPGLRLPLDDVPIEILPVVQAVNSAFARLEAGYQLQREFTADAAHELRTPLAVLSAQIDLIDDERLRFDLRKNLDKLSRLVAQLLKAAQIDNLTIAPDELADLHSIAVEVATFLSPLAIRGDLEIEVTGVEHPVMIRGHSEAIFDALRNLVENALSHSPPKGVVTIEVDAERKLLVIDRGPGIPPDKRELIFNRFWRANRKTSGSGLGLSIVQRIAEAHHARLSVEDTPGGGSTFILQFPPHL